MNLPQKKYWYLIPFLFIYLVPHLSAIKTIAVYQLKTANLNEQTGQTINNLIFSFIKEQKNYRVIGDDLRTAYAPKTYPVDISPDFIFFGTIEEAADGIHVELVLKGRKEQQTRRIFKVYKNFNTVLLNSRLLVSKLLDFSVKLEQIPKKEEPVLEDIVFGPVTTLDSLTGSWKGEQGIERVMILKGGRGILVFSSGISVSLDCTIEDGWLTIRQKGAVQPRQLLGLPDTIALQAAQRTEAPYWRFFVSPDNKILSGTKKDVHISYNETDITDIVYDTAYVEWQRY